MSEKCPLAHLSAVGLRELLFGGVIRVEGIWEGTVSVQQYYIAYTACDIVHILRLQARENVFDVVIRVKSISDSS